MAKKEISLLTTQELLRLAALFRELERLQKDTSGTENSDEIAQSKSEIRAILEPIDSSSTASAATLAPAPSEIDEDFFDIFFADAISSSSIFSEKSENNLYLSELKERIDRIEPAVIEIQKVTRGFLGRKEYSKIKAESKENDKKRLKAIEDEIAKLRKEIAKLQEQQANFEKDLNGFNSNFDAVDSHLNNQDEIINQLQERIDELAERIETLEIEKAELGGRIEDQERLSAELQNQQREFQENIDQLKQALKTQNQNISSLQQLIDSTNKKTDQKLTEVADFFGQQNQNLLQYIAELSERLRELEDIRLNRDAVNSGDNDSELPHDSQFINQNPSSFGNNNRGFNDRGNVVVNNYLQNPAANLTDENLRNLLAQINIINASLESLRQLIEERSQQNIERSNRIEDVFTDSFDQALTNLETNIQTQIDTQIQDLTNQYQGLNDLITNLNLNNRLDGIDATIAGLDPRLDGIDATIAGLEPRLDGIDANVGVLGTRLNGIDATLNNQGVIINGLDNAINSQNAAIQQNTASINNLNATTLATNDFVASLHSELKRKNDAEEKAQKDEEKKKRVGVLSKNAFDDFRNDAKNKGRLVNNLVASITGGVKEDDSGVQMTNYGVPLFIYDDYEAVSQYRRDIDAAIAITNNADENSTFTSLTGKQQRGLISIAKLTNEPTKTRGHVEYAVSVVSSRGVSRSVIDEAQYQSQIHTPLEDFYQTQLAVRKNVFESTATTGRIEAIFNFDDLTRSTFRGAKSQDLAIRTEMLEEIKAENIAKADEKYQELERNGYDFSTDNSGVPITDDQKQEFKDLLIQFEERNYPQIAEILTEKAKERQDHLDQVKKDIEAQGRENVVKRKYLEIANTIFDYHAYQQDMLKYFDSIASNDIIISNFIDINFPYNGSGNRDLKPDLAAIFGSDPDNLNQVQNLIDELGTTADDAEKIAKLKEIFGLVDTSRPTKAEILTHINRGEYSQIDDKLIDSSNGQIHRGLLAAFDVAGNFIEDPNTALPVSRGFLTRNQYASQLISEANSVRRSNNPTIEAEVQNEISHLINSAGIAEEQARINEMKDCTKNIENYPNDNADKLTKNILFIQIDILDRYVSRVIQNNNLAEKIAERQTSEIATRYAEKFLQKRVIQAVQQSSNVAAISPEEKRIMANGDKHLERVLSATLPAAPLGGVSFLENSRNQTTVLFAADQDGNYGSNDAVYIHIKGTDQAYVKAVVCTEKNMDRIVEENGVTYGYRAIINRSSGETTYEKHKVGDVVIDHNTVYHYDSVKEKDGKIKLGVDGKPIYKYKAVAIDDDASNKAKNLATKGVNLFRDTVGLATLGLTNLVTRKFDSKSEGEKEFGKDGFARVRQMVKQMEILAVSVDQHNERSVATMHNGKVINHSTGKRGNIEVAKDSVIRAVKGSVDSSQFFRKKHPLERRIDKDYLGEEVAFEFDEKGELKNKSNSRYFTTDENIDIDKPDELYQISSILITDKAIKNAQVKLAAALGEEVELFGRVAVVEKEVELETDFSGAILNREAILSERTGNVAQGNNFYFLADSNGIDKPIEVFKKGNPDSFSDEFVSHIQNKKPDINFDDLLTEFKSARADYLANSSTVVSIKTPSTTLDKTISADDEGVVEIKDEKRAVSGHQVASIIRPDQKITLQSDVKSDLLSLMAENVRKNTEPTSTNEDQINAINEVNFAQALKSVRDQAETEKSNNTPNWFRGFSTSKESRAFPSTAARSAEAIPLPQVKIWGKGFNQASNQHNAALPPKAATDLANISKSTGGKGGK
jgi:hypothetical protein